MVRNADVLRGGETAPVWRVDTIRLQLGPCPSSQDLFCALGDALARSGLVARTLEILVGTNGYILNVDCDSDGGGTDVLDAVARLRECDHRAVVDGRRRYPTCSLAR